MDAEGTGERKELVGVRREVISWTEQLSEVVSERGDISRLIESLRGVRAALEKRRSLVEVQVEKKGSTHMDDMYFDFDILGGDGLFDLDNLNDDAMLMSDDLPDFVEEDILPPVVPEVITPPPPPRAKKKRAPNSKGKKVSLKKTTKNKTPTFVKIKFSVAGQSHKRVLAAFDPESPFLARVKPQQMSATAKIGSNGKKAAMPPSNTTSSTIPLFLGKSHIAKPPKDTFDLIQKSESKKAHKKQEMPPLASRLHEADGPLVRTVAEGATTQDLWKWLQDYRYHAVDEHTVLARASSGLDAYKDSHYLGSPLLSTLLFQDRIIQPNAIPSLSQDPHAKPNTGGHSATDALRQRTPSITGTTVAPPPMPAATSKAAAARAQAALLEEKKAEERRRSSLTRRLVAALLPPTDTLTGTPTTHSNKNYISTPVSSSSQQQSEENPTPDGVLFDKCLAQACLDAGIVFANKDFGQQQSTSSNAGELYTSVEPRQDTLPYVRARSIAAHLRRVADSNSAIALRLATQIKIDNAATAATKGKHAQLEVSWRRLLKKQQDLAKRKKLEAKQTRKPSLPW